MMTSPSFKIAILAGDGIGPEVMGPAVDLLQEATRRAGGFLLDLEFLGAGAAHYQKTGVSFPDTEASMPASGQRP